MKKRAAAKKRPVRRAAPRQTKAIVLADILAALQRLERGAERDRERLIGIEKMLELRSYDPTAEAGNMAALAGALRPRDAGDDEEEEREGDAESFLARLDKVCGNWTPPPAETYDDDAVDDAPHEEASP